jgi:hypothetical protein
MKALTRSAMARQSSIASKWVTKGANAAADWVMRNISTDCVNLGQHEYCKLSDYYLVDLAEGLAHHPQGVDRGLLTVAVEHAMRHNHHNIKISDLVGYIRNENLEHRYAASRTWGQRVIDADRVAYTRHFPSSRYPESPVQAFWRIGGYKHN